MQNKKFTLSYVKAWASKYVGTYYMCWFFIRDHFIAAYLGILCICDIILQAIAEEHSVFGASARAWGLSWWISAPLLFRSFIHCYRGLLFQQDLLELLCAQASFILAYFAVPVPHNICKKNGEENMKFGRVVDSSKLFGLHTTRLPSWVHPCCNMYNGNLRSSIQSFSRLLETLSCLPACNLHMWRCM